ncbi:hypothetical protein OG426_48155 [Streptomyces canus]|uniref:hypothetical protein n=1 Tax=Streptomyces canus TaxID=58343 RepID=UPI00224E17B1|nr:hypothetical protein [Streptomyces canus]MCX4854942.1 hypothetical protein [Streptomyces canus]WSW39659.1 hypothetical protein OG426_48155 [Streptomyces canus]
MLLVEDLRVVRAGLVSLRDDPFDVGAVVLDIGMPGLDDATAGPCRAGVFALDAGITYSC